MAIVFKLAQNAPSEAEVQHSNFKEHYPEVNHSMAWDELTPYVEQATEVYVLPYVGQELYDAIAAAYNAGDALNTKQQRFLRLLQRAVAYYTIAHALPKKLAVVASMGAVNNTPAGGAQPVSQWSFKNQLWSVIKDADTFLDQLLEFLQKEVDAENADFAAWKNSAAYLEGKADLFRSTRAFQTYHSINGSYRTFLALIPYIQKAARKYVIPILGQAQYDELVAGLRDNDLSADQLALLQRVQSCLAEWSIYMALPALSCIIENDGLKVVSRTDGMDTRGNVASTFGKEAIDRHQYACEENGRTFRIDLIDYLYRNADTFPTWKDSDFYKQGNDSGVNVIGSDTGGVWI